MLAMFSCQLAFQLALVNGKTMLCATEKLWSAPHNQVPEVESLTHVYGLLETSREYLVLSRAYILC